MNFLKHVVLFINNNFRQLQRKWFILPLILLFPVIIITLITTIIISIFTPDEYNPIHIGLVDLDQSMETTSVVELIEESSQLGTFIQLHSMSEIEAQSAIRNNLISTYVIFPDDFTENLYNGTSVTLEMVGNPQKQTDSYLAKELLESITRHISASQANILTINYYAKELAIDNETRSDLLYEQFTNFLFYTIGKDRTVNEKEILNQATTSPLHYYTLSSWFIVMSVWLLSIYYVLSKEHSLRLKNRMRLYGVTNIQQIIAKIMVTIIITTIFSILAFIGMERMIDWDLSVNDFVRITNITLLYCIIFIVNIAIIEGIIESLKLRLLAQSIFTGLVLLISGAIIPTLYFPLNVQGLMPYSFSSQSLLWLQEIVLNARLYIDYVPLLLMNAIGICVLLGLLLWKERRFP
ncbi:ABC transporter permease [Virgibacillus byunsanensis]|uniref:ABC transporter permease n=1 Tax=Virgibacillus byunsanensis TaxID=570945 RepID=A0ABW3LNH4_9BACI